MAESNEQKIQYILDENHKLKEMLKADAEPVEHPIKYRLKSAFEVFVRVKGTDNYWISNYGRCVNNMNRKDLNTFYEHKQGNVHYTIFEIERYQKKDKRGKLTGEMVMDKYKIETSPADLVAAAFLVKYRGRCKVWHKDSDASNNWYKNLIYVTEKDYKNLKSGKVAWESLDYGQEYIEYENRADSKGYEIYGGIRARCSEHGRKDNIGKCYSGTTMCKEWLDNPKSFVMWYLEHYYEVEGESMAVDKDLFGDGDSVYSPENCCVLPQGLNAMLANCKKHYYEGTDVENALPLGVCYSGRVNKYYGKITFNGSERNIQLSDWDTPEEAFAEYKKMKQADILIVAARYKEKIPQYIYEKLLEIDVKPY